MKLINEGYPFLIALYSFKTLHIEITNLMLHYKELSCHLPVMLHIEITNLMLHYRKMAGQLLDMINNKIETFFTFIDLEGCHCKLLVLL